MKRLFVAIIIVVLALPISASLSLHDIYTQEHIYYTHNNHLESASSGTTDVKPYSGEFFCRAAMPVDIQWPGFALKAEMVLKEFYENGLWVSSPQSNGKITIQRKCLTRVQHTYFAREIE